MTMIMTVVVEKSMAHRRCLVNTGKMGKPMGTYAGGNGKFNSEM